MPSTLNSDDDQLHNELEAFRPQAKYELTQRLLVQAIGFIYFVAFGSLSVQVLPLLGADGLLPVTPFLQWIGEAVGGHGIGFVELPSLFWLNSSDGALQSAAIVGTLLSLIVVVGRGNAPLLLALWMLYLSFVHVGQTFYGYGWENLLLEAGLLCCFVAPVWRRSAPSGLACLLLMVLFRWLTFRLLFGAGLIKIRGDDCWRDLTCLVTHYETQPNPHPLSWLLHQAPVWFHKVGVLFNHFVELIVPFFVFGPRRARIAAGVLIILFQISLILSGNLSFLNWLTIAIALSCWDDEVFLFLRTQLCRLAKKASLPSSSPSIHSSPPTRIRLGVTVTWCLIVTALSLDPLSNLLGTRQKMNASYNRLHLVNSYGAFGTIHRTRHEVILEGTSEELGPHTKWKAYEFPCKPGRVDRAPCLVTPYHHRLQWQMWFASFGDPHREAWLPHLVYKLLHGRESVAPLLTKNPFPKRPPRYIRVRLFEYHWTSWGEEGWWHRQPAGQWMRPVSKEDHELTQLVDSHGWPTYEPHRVPRIIKKSNPEEGLRVNRDVSTSISSSAK